MFEEAPVNTGAVTGVVVDDLVRDGRIESAHVMKVTLSADHCVIDGALAAKWLQAFNNRVENPIGLLV